MTLTVQETPHDADKDNSSLLFCQPLDWLLQSGENLNYNNNRLGLDWKHYSEVKKKPWLKQIIQITGSVSLIFAFTIASLQTGALDWVQQHRSTLWALLSFLSCEKSAFGTTCHFLAFLTRDIWAHKIGHIASPSIICLFTVPVC